MKLNFDNIEIYDNLSKTTSHVQNIREDFANYIYNKGEGIAAHALALKIYNGTQETEFNENELNLIRMYSRGCTPAIIDAITEMVAKSVGIPMQ